MKKFVMIAAVALVAMSMQAAQINWGLQGQVKFNNTLVGNGGATFTLVCLDGIADWATYANDVAIGATDGVAATKKTNAGSMSTATAGSWGPFTFGSTTDIANKSVADGTDFAFVVTTVQGGETYFWASDVFSVSEASPNYNPQEFTYTMSTTVANAMGATGTNWTKAVTIPEPASAMLALAGVAMLIRRRK